MWRVELHVEFGYVRGSAHPPRPTMVTMPLPVSLRLLFHQAHPREEQAAAHIEGGQRQASDLTEANRRRIVAETILALSNPGDTLRAALDRPDLQSRVFGIELRVLWGFYSEHEKMVSTTVPAADRVVAALALWLCKVHDFQWSAAIMCAREVELAQAEAVPDEFVDAGRRAYHSPRDDIYVAALRAKA